jgi:hypothetical protein
MRTVTKNIGGTDQTIRLIAGLVLLSVVIIGSGGWRWFGLIGLIPLLSAIFRVCPLYLTLGINTCDKEAPHV